MGIQKASFPKRNEAFLFPNAPLVQPAIRGRLAAAIA